MAENLKEKLHVCVCVHFTAPWSKMNSFRVIDGRNVLTLETNVLPLYFT